MPEIRRLMEGRRVDAEIENKIREMKRGNSPTTSPTNDLRGKTVPRESDRRMLEEFDQRVQSTSTTS